MRAGGDHAQGVERSHLAVAETQLHRVDAGLGCRRDAHDGVVDALDQRRRLDGGDCLTVRADAIASDTIVRFRPALANASPEIVTLAPGLTVVELRPIVNGELFVTCAAGATGAPPDDAASAAGAAARAVAAMAPMPASLRGRDT